MIAFGTGDTSTVSPPARCHVRSHPMHTVTVVWYPGWVSARAPSSFWINACRTSRLLAVGPISSRACSAASRQSASSPADSSKTSRCVTSSGS